MPSIEVAHVREQGQDMIIVPMNDQFGRKPQSDQHAVINEIQRRASGAGLAGTVVAVWPGGFIAPRPWHPFFRTFSYGQALANVNRSLSW
jgi:hypothetical protein